MKDDGIKEILVIPLYPQYSSATTATVVDKVNECLGKCVANQLFVMQGLIFKIKNI